MPGKKKPGPSVKDDEVYESIRDEGGSKEKAARIANASANSSRGKPSPARVARPARTTTGPLTSCGSGPKNSACRDTPARRSPSSSPCSVTTEHIGTSGWSYDHWEHVLYPPGLADP